MSLRHALAATLVLSSSGCGVLEPRVPEPQPDVFVQWPLPPTTAAAGALSSSASSASSATSAPAPSAPTSSTTTPAAAADIGWRDFFIDPRLQELIRLSLESNRDLRVAVLDVERSRELYGIQRSERVPSISANASLVRQGGDVPVTDTYSANLAATQFELDLWGRVRSLSKSALEQYFATDAARRSAQLSLIAAVAGTYLTLAADREQLRLSQATLQTREEAYTLTQKRHDLGAVSALDVYQAKTQTESARADTARYAGQVAQDVDALTLLVGAPVPAELLPAGFERDATGLDPLPAGMPSDVLLRRPDVVQAEHTLRAANANIGAARAAFFPTITLTGAVGTSSTELDSLFNAGTSTWSFIPQVSLPIFQGGRLRAGLGVATADRDIALARYEQAIQQGFREVSDALALTATLAEQRVALEQLVDAAQKAEYLSLASYEAGRDSYLTRLESQRTLYVSQQALISTRLAEQSNRVTLYKVLGGGWQEHSP
jgi:multidrug efflux system outer membrane protein